MAQEEVCQKIHLPISFTLSSPHTPSLTTKSDRGHHHFALFIVWNTSLGLVENMLKFRFPFLQISFPCPPSPMNGNEVLPDSVQLTISLSLSNLVNRFSWVLQTLCGLF